MSDGADLGDLDVPRAARARTVAVVDVAGDVAAFGTTWAPMFFNLSSSSDRLGDRRAVGQLRDHQSAANGR